MQGVLTGHGEGRFLALNAVAVTGLASGFSFAVAAMGSIVAAFAIVVVGCWVLYLNGLRRIHRIAGARAPYVAAEAAVPVA